ncbi:MAG: hypothetical protein HFF09_06670 [Oscillospiraceae bacterium]|nr:hypothetical protein [Oscillospiraceae bacterium]
MAMEYFCAYHSYREWMTMLSDAERGRLFSALLAYSSGEAAPELSGREAVIFPAMRWNIDRDRQTYADKCERNRRNGAKGGERPPNAPQGKGEGKREGKVNPPLSEGGDARARGARFVPPTLDEVRAYVAERKSPVDAQAFLDFYESKGWMVGKNPMKDWKAACRNAEKWEQWTRPAKAPKGPQAGVQPSPEGDERAKASMERLRERMKRETMEP